MSMRIVFALWFATALAGCSGAGGGGSRHRFTCDVQDGSTTTGERLNRCIEGEARLSSDVPSACSFAGGHLNYEPCRTDGLLGRCEDVDFDGLATGTLFLFPDDLVSTPTGAKSLCDSFGGNFVAVTPGGGGADGGGGGGGKDAGGSYPDGVAHAAADTNRWSCRADSLSYLCQEYPNVVAGDRADAIVDSCPSSVATLGMTGCSRSGSIGYCEATGDLGVVRYYFYYTPDYEADEAQKCAARGQTWYTL